MSPSQFTWNYHNIVNWLYPNTNIFFVKSKKTNKPHFVLLSDLKVTFSYNLGGWVPRLPHIGQQTAKLMSAELHSFAVQRPEVQCKATGCGPTEGSQGASVPGFSQLLGAPSVPWLMAAQLWSVSIFIASRGALCLPPLKTFVTELTPYNQGFLMDIKILNFTSLQKTLCSN